MATARDVAIIILALESIVIGILLVFLIFQIRGLIRLLREEVEPILDSVKETTKTVRGTTAFVSDTVVSPVMRVASIVSALRRIIDFLARRRTE
ncbi:MAG: hypothetical protein U9Q78_08415 [Chloroflexota bacterium]|nr:hypothetical protein [Chloroflexota bacterium]